MVFSKHDQFTLSLIQPLPLYLGVYFSLLSSEALSTIPLWSETFALLQIYTSIHGADSQIVCVALLMGLAELSMRHTKKEFCFDIIVSAAKDKWLISVPYQIKIGNMLLLHSPTRIQFQARVWTTLKRLSP
jgi:hypothetical protein